MATAKAWTKEPYVDTLSSGDKLRYASKSTACGGDPYAMNRSDFSEDESLWPRIGLVEINEYLVLSTSYLTKKQMKAHRSLEAHNYVTSGWVKKPATKLVDGKRTLAVAEVNHSQALREPPVVAWILLEDDGDVVCAHCTCMAGIGEVCSHIAAVLFFFQIAAQHKDGQSCTEKENRWLPCYRKSATQGPIVHLDFSSAKKRKQILDDPCKEEGNRKSTNNQASKHTATYQVPSDEKYKEFLARLSKNGSKPVLLSIMEPHCSDFIPELSKFPYIMLREVYSAGSLCKDWNSLIAECEALVNSMELSTRAKNLIQEQTKEQAGSSKWFGYRQGRVTASVFYDVCHATVRRPPISLIQKICEIEKPLNVPAVKWGRQQEPAARVAYKTLAECRHVDVTFQECGFFVSLEAPFVGATPDGLISCSCCGEGVYELKCPYSAVGLPFEKALELPSFCLESTCAGTIQLRRNSKYLHQLQLQMYCTERKYADIVIWTPAWVHVERVPYDASFMSTELVKAKAFFREVIMPELRAHWFTKRLNTPTASSNQPLGHSPGQLTTTATQDVHCICRQPEKGRMICCDNAKCAVQWFHFKCIGMTCAPRKEWFCTSCKRK